MSSFKKVGKWDIAKLLTSNLKRDVKDEMSIALKQIGLEAEGELKKYIIGQKGNWKELNEKYLAYKKRKGLSNKTLIASSTMLLSITSVEAYPIVFVGVKRGKKENNGEDVANIAAIMEFGNDKINLKPRPFIQPVNDIMRERMDNNLLGKRIVEILRKKYGTN